MLKSFREHITEIARETAGAGFSEAAATAIEIVFSEIRDDDDDDDDSEYYE